MVLWTVFVFHFSKIINGPQAEILKCVFYSHMTIGRHKTIQSVVVTAESTSLSTMSTWNISQHLLWSFSTIYSTGQGFFHQTACPRLVIIFAPCDPVLPSAHSPPATVFFPTAICRDATAECSSYLYNHAVGSPGVDDENIWHQNDWQLRKIDTKMMLKRLMRTV